MDVTLAAGSGDLSVTVRDLAVRAIARCLVGAGVLLGWVTDTKADWQYTRWGMTLEQVLAASQGAAWANSAETFSPQAYQLALALGKYSVDDMNFDVRFLFGAQDRLLRCVALRLPDVEKRNQLEVLLTRFYGSPHRVERTSVLEKLIWDGVDQIAFTKLKNLSAHIDFVMIMYCSRRGYGL